MTEQFFYLAGLGPIVLSGFFILLIGSRAYRPDMLGFADVGRAHSKNMVNNVAAMTALLLVFALVNLIMRMEFINWRHAGFIVSMVACYGVCYCLFYFYAAARPLDMQRIVKQKRIHGALHVLFAGFFITMVGVTNLPYRHAGFVIVAHYSAMAYSSYELGRETKVKTGWRGTLIFVLLSIMLWAYSY